MIHHRTPGITMNRWLYTCNCEESPRAEDDNDDDTQIIEFVACGCAEWHHIVCANNKPFTELDLYLLQVV